MKHSIYFLGAMVAAFLLMIAPAAHAQDQWQEGGEIESVEIQIIKERQITLPRANRNFDKVPPRPAEPTVPAISYDFKNLRYVAPPYAPVIRPLRLKAEEISKLYGRFISAGVGNYASPYAEAYITSKRDKKKMYGAHLYHRSFGTGPVDAENSASGNTRVHLFGREAVNKVMLYGDARIDSRLQYFYGYTPRPEVRRDTIRQRFATTAFRLGLENALLTKFSYQADANFSYLTDAFAAAETEVSARAQLAYHVDKTKKMSTDLVYSLNARKDAQSDAVPRSLLTLQPVYQSRWGKFTLASGAVGVLENDRPGAKQQFHLYPYLFASYPLAKSVVAQGTFTGGYDRINLHQLSAENPWLAPDIGLRHTNRLADLSTQLRAVLRKKVSASAGAGFIRYGHLYFFENSTADRAKFQTVYSDASRAQLFTEWGWSHAQKSQLTFRADYFSYSVSQIAEAWHKPTYQLGLRHTVNFNQKILLKSGVVVLGGMRARDVVSNTIIVLDPAIDVQLRADYFVSKQFSFFVAGENLLNQSYPLFLRYEARGLQAMGGLSYSF
jgi:hypothetical protein